MKNTLLFLLILTGIAFPACKKHNSIPNYPVDADLKAAFNYQPGTYWIYRDSISGSIDSFAVRKNIFIPGNQNSIGNIYNYTDDEINIYITVYNGGSVNDTFVWELSLITNNESLNWYSNGIDLMQVIPVFTYPFKVGIDSTIDAGGNPDKTYTTNIFSSYALNSTNFSNVAETYNDVYNDTFYINADIGYIKMKINHDTINKAWELERWNIKV